MGELCSSCNMVGEEVRDGVCMSWDVFEAVVKVLEELHPSGLTACNFLWLSEVLQVFMIHSDHNWMVGT